MSERERNEVGIVPKRTESHVVIERFDCDRTVIRQGQNPEEHRGLRTHTERSF